MKNNCGVFQIRNIVTDQVYIGYSNRIQQTRSEFFYKLRNNIYVSKELQKSFDKYGEENFEYSILEYCNEKEVLNIKQKWMDFTKCYKKEFGFNQSYDSSNKKFIENWSGRIPYECTDLQKNKISKSKKGKKRPIESVEKSSEGRRKYNHLLNKWKTLHSEGMSLCKIANIYKTDHHTVKRYLKTNP